MREVRMSVLDGGRAAAVAVARASHSLMLVNASIKPMICASKLW